MDSRQQDEQRAADLDVAVIGMAVRLPGAPDLDTFWHNLEAGVESVRFFTDEELHQAGVSPALVRAPGYVKASPTLDGYDGFDAAYFDLNPTEAQILDPQRRLLLEGAVTALEHAGYPPDGRHLGAVGVFAGVGLNGYAIHNLSPDRELTRNIGDLALLLASDKDYAPTQVSYKLDLTGPSVAVQTACSTSLVAVHLARQSLLLGECDLALAGGSSVNVPHLAGHLFQEGGILSPDGHCRVFDADARGTIFGSGCALVVLKRLADALADGDTIHAVLKGSALNNDGAHKVGFTAPSVDGQAAVVVEALASAGVDASTITYVEAHGTGTELGDPVEVAALTRAFREQTEERGFCALGSVKGNIGHLNAAAGAAGLVKAVLALSHRAIPATLHYRTPNPKLDLESSPFFVNAALQPWQPPAGVPRRCGVSSLGIGGTNAHVVLEEPPPDAVAADRRGPAPHPASAAPAPADHVWLLSARSPEALDEASEQLALHLEAQPAIATADATFTLQLGRVAHEHRRAWVAATPAEAVAKLRFSTPGLHDGHAPRPRPLVFLFPGQGAQFVGMGADLYRDVPVYRQAFDRTVELFREALDVDLRALIFASGDAAAAAGQRLAETHLTQPAVFAVEYALAEALESLGLVPAAMIGHSLGELVALARAGVLTLEDAVAVVARRGTLMGAMARGAMLAVAAPWERVLEAAVPGIELAAANAPQACTVGGPGEAVSALAAALERTGVPFQRLQTSHAFHTALMEPMLDDLARAVAARPRGVPARRVASNLTGGWYTAELAADPQSFARHVRSPVLFARGLETIFAAEPEAITVEVGPGQGLSALVRAVRREAPVAATLPRRSASSPAPLGELVARLWSLGATVDWSPLRSAPARRIPLPTYPFQRDRCWIEARPDAAAAPALQTKLPDLADWFSVPAFRGAPSPRVEPPPAGDLVVVDDEAGMAEVLGARLSARGHRVVRLRLGDAFARHDRDSFSVDRTRPIDFRSFALALRDEQIKPTAIVFLPLFGRREPFTLARGPEQLADSLHRGFFSLLYLVQGLGQAGLMHPIDLFLVTSDLHDLTGDEALRPDRAPLLGQAKVIQQEYHNLRCRAVDLPAPASASPLEPLAELLADELAIPAGDLAVVHRGGRRWAQGYEPVRLETASRHWQSIARGGAYLVTGGLLGIGAVVTEHLSLHAGARLLLLEEADFPPEDRWTRWLAENDAQHLTSLRISKALDFKARGAVLHVVPCALHAADALARAVRAYEADAGPIRGLVHALGGSAVGRMGSVSESSEGTCARNFRALAEGMLALDAVFAEQSLEFRVALGSLGSVLGGVGYVSYGAASAFMSAYAAAVNRLHPGRWTVHSWDSWTLEWTFDERIITLIRENLIERLQPIAIAEEEGLECFRRMFTVDGAAQVVVSATDLRARYDHWVKLKSVRAASPPRAEQRRRPRPRIAEEHIAPRSPTERTIVEVWQDLLGLDGIGVYDNFYELGGNSLLATQLVARLREVLGVDIAMSAMFEDPTVSNLASIYIARRAVQNLFRARAAGATP